MLFGFGKFGKFSPYGKFGKPFAPWPFYAPIGVAAGAFDYLIGPGFAKFPPGGFI